MPFDSEGNFTRIHCWEDDRLNDIDIASDRHDEEDDNFADALSTCMLRDGRCTMTGNLDMGNYQIKNVSAGTANGDAVNKLQLSTVDGNAVHKTGDEIVAGNKVFSGSVSMSSATATSMNVTTMSVSEELYIPGGRIWIA